MRLTREQEIACRAAVKAASGDPLMISIRALLNNDYEKARDAMVDASAADLPSAQGAARAARQALKSLTV